MNNPFLQSAQSRLFYVSIWAIIMIAQVFLVNHTYRLDIIDSSYSVYYDSLIYNTLQAICILALWYPAIYYRNILSIPLFLLFHLFLLLISFAIWIGLGYLLTHSILANDSIYTSFFLTTLPLRLFFGILIYIIFILVYNLQLSISEMKVQKSLIESAKADATLNAGEKLTRISVKKKQEIHFIPVNQIFYIEANGDYVLIHTAETKYLKDRTMKYWETHLSDDIFIRIHRSFIINIEQIAKIELFEKEIYKVQLKNGESLKVSNAGYKLLKQKMQL
jgi:hypothetical protein